MIALLLRRLQMRGLPVDGRNLHALMPRFDLTDAKIDALLHYLQQDHMIPGVSQDTITAATILPLTLVARARRGECTNRWKVNRQK